MTTRIWFAILWTLVILVSCLVPAQSVPDSPAPSFDKLVHFALFFIFVPAWSGWTPTLRAIVWIAAAGLVYGLGTELLQAILPGGRQAEVLDVLANAGGVLIGTVVVFLVRNRGST